MAYKYYLRIFFWILCPLILINCISMATFVYNPKWFYFRPWEYFPELAYKFSEYEALWDIEETSDGTRKNFFYYQDPHRTYVSVDNDGFRKNYKYGSFEVLVSGDSTIFGTSLSDNETLPWKISEKLNISVFNGGRSSLYNTLLRPELSDVKIIIDCVAERKIKNKVFPSYGWNNGDGYKPLMTNNKDIFSIFNEVPPQRYLATLIAARTVSRIARDLVVFLFGLEDKHIFHGHKFNKSSLERAINSIVERKNNINAQGMEYIFIAIPAKQTIYDDTVDEYTKNYINLLTTNLKKKGVKTINILDSFRANKLSSIYHHYDTHWNSKGVSVAASVIAEYLAKNYKVLNHLPDYQTMR